MLVQRALRPSLSLPAYLLGLCAQALHTSHDDIHAMRTRGESERALLRMSLARCAKRRVLSVSAMLRLDELTLAIMNVLELPPSESCSQHAASAECGSNFCCTARRQPADLQQAR